MFASQHWKKFKIDSSIFHDNIDQTNAISFPSQENHKWLPNPDENDVKINGKIYLTTIPSIGENGAVYL